MELSSALNQSCPCPTLDAEAIRSRLGISEQSHPHLFSNTVSFVSAEDASAMARTIETIERVSQLPGYQEQALAQAPAVAHEAWGPLGVFMGYDFHIDARGPHLIEINTNAGGAVLNAMVLDAHHACCAPLEPLQALHPQSTALLEAFLQMFQAEWRLHQQGSAHAVHRALRTVAIVDDAPQQQYLAPEFAQCVSLFAQRGIQAMVTDPNALEWRDGALWHPALPGTPIDMVYNRLTDFYLQEANHAALHQAYTAGAVALTPHPRAHAVFADKRRLIALSDDAQLAAWGVSAADRAWLMQVVPKTMAVTTDQADKLWAQRKQLFFKPATGYGSKGTYRGEKLTRGVWADIVAGDYVAQTEVAPGERLVQIEGATQMLKQDIRAYAYAGTIQLLAARSYRGQTTNFRTPGGGFSPVMVLPPPHMAPATAANAPSACDC